MRPAAVEGGEAPLQATLGDRRLAAAAPRLGRLAGEAAGPPRAAENPLRSGIFRLRKQAKKLRLGTPRAGRADEKPLLGHWQSSRAGKKPLLGCLQTPQADEKALLGHLQTSQAGEKALLGHLHTSLAGKKPLLGHLLTPQAGEKALLGHPRTCRAGEKPPLGHREEFPSRQKSSARAPPDSPTPTKKLRLDARGLAEWTKNLRWGTLRLPEQGGEASPGRPASVLSEVGRRRGKGLGQGAPRARPARGAPSRPGCISRGHPAQARPRAYDGFSSGEPNPARLPAAFVQALSAPTLAGLA